MVWGTHNICCTPNIFRLYKVVRVQLIDAMDLSDLLQKGRVPFEAPAHLDKLLHQFYALQVAILPSHLLGCLG